MPDTKGPKDPKDPKDLWKQFLESRIILPRENMRTDHPSIRINAAQGRGNLNSDFTNLLRQEGLEYVVARWDERIRRLYLHCSAVPSKNEEEAALKVIFGKHNVPATIAFKGVLRNIGYEPAKSIRLDVYVIESTKVPPGEKVLYIDIPPER